MAPEVLRSWIKIRGDETLRLDYDLNEKSVVFDFGSYKGQWARKVKHKYGCDVYCFEPIYEFYDQMQDDLGLTLFPVAVSDHVGTKFIAVDKDRTSFHTKENTQEVSVIDFQTCLQLTGVEKVDLLKMNIEGEEYPVLVDMIQKGFIEKCTDVQVQFHTNYPGYFGLYDYIRSELAKTHVLTYRYPFVWENWAKIK